MTVNTQMGDKYPNCVFKYVLGILQEDIPNKVKKELGVNDNKFYDLIVLDQTKALQDIMETGSETSSGS